MINFTSDTICHFSFDLNLVVELEIDLQLKQVEYKLCSFYISFQYKDFEEVLAYWGHS